MRFQVLFNVLWIGGTVISLYHNMITVTIDVIEAKAEGIGQGTKVPPRKESIFNAGKRMFKVKLPAINGIYLTAQ